MKTETLPSEAWNSLQEMVPASVVGERLCVFLLLKERPTAPNYSGCRWTSGAGGALGMLRVPSWLKTHPRCEKKTMWHCFKHCRKRASVVLLAPLRLQEIPALGYSSADYASSRTTVFKHLWKHQRHARPAWTSDHRFVIASTSTAFDTKM